MSIITVHLTFSNLNPHALVSANEFRTIAHVLVGVLVTQDDS